MSEVRPPRLFTKFFKWYCKAPLQESILGDLEEAFYTEVESKGQLIARWKYIWTILRFIRPGIVRSLEGTQKLNNYGMIKNNIKIGMRSILRNKVFSILNVTGLSVGLASCLLILIYVKHELSYDTYNANYESTYRVLHYFGEEGADLKNEVFPRAEHQVWGNAPIAPALKEFYPEIESIFRFTSSFNWLIEYEGKRFQEKDVVFADSTFYKIFSWDWLAGNPETALVRPATIILSEKLAKKYFGNKNPIGESLLMDGDDLFEVTGVYHIPDNSHFSADAFVSMSTFKGFRPQIFDSWGYVDFYTYFTLNNQANIETLSAKIPDFLTTYHESEYGYTFQFEPLKDAYLNSEAGRQPGPIGSKSNIYLFVSVAVFILLIACINFVNISTARSIDRAKEVAVRKTLGSRRSPLISQFLIESVLITFFAAIVAVLMVSLGHGYLELFIGKQLSVDWLFSPVSLLIGLLLVLLLGVLAGLYPAFILSNYRPLQVLRGSFKNSSKGIWLRKSLVVLQFALSIMLLAGTAIVYQQLNYIRDYDKGFESEQILVIDYGGDYKVKRNIDFIKAELLKHSAVESVSVSRATPGDFFPNAGTTIETPNGEMLAKSPAIYEIDEDFIPTYDMQMVAGRNFSKSFPTDTTKALLVNEATAKLYGYSNPEDIVGKNFSQWGREGKVIGVVEDFNYVSLHSEVEPLALRYSIWWSTEKFSVKLKSTDLGSTLGGLEAIWKEAVPSYPFNTYFNDMSFNNQYEADERFGIIFYSFSILAVFVACLGLFGLTIYTTNQRAKEIGIRKVLGASVQRIVTILSFDFIKLYGIALLLAIPVAYWIMSTWLASFAYQTSIGWQVFGFAASITLAVSLLTMSFKTIGAAMSNPTRILKDE
ncbi:ABC transporter permease [Roseivirga pacifica]|uniref:ABC transporter permease n=1 Tax=Roseivirga pacifica TaxID=1267423 RepID=UPI003BB0986B